MITIDKTLDTIMELDVSSREMLLEILQKRLIEERRVEMARNGKRAKSDFNSGKIIPTTAANAIRKLNSL